MGITTGKQLACSRSADEENSERGRRFIVGLLCCTFGGAIIFVGCKAKEPNKLPDFDWPPPKPSAAWTKDVRKLNPSVTNWGQCSELISEALKEPRLSYFAVPGGFATATRMHCVDDNGLPFTADRACVTNGILLRDLSLASLKLAAGRMFSGELSRCRAVVVIVSDEPFSTKETTTPSKASEWIDRGLNRLPPQLRTNTITEAHALSVLIYEFSRSPADASITQVFPGETDGRKKSIGLNL